MTVPERIDFCIVKATEGFRYVDPCCDGFVQQCKRKGILYGFYHFARNNDPEQEAAFFWEHTKGYVREGIPVLDIEDEKIPDWGERVAWVGEWYSTSAKQTIIRDACAKYGCAFIDISDLPSVSGNQSYVGATYIDANGQEQTITNSGVASHPSDQGFTQISESIIATLFE